MDDQQPFSDYRLIPGWTDFESVYKRAVEEVPEGGTLVEVGSWVKKLS